MTGVLIVPIDRRDVSGPAAPDSQLLDLNNVHAEALSYFTADRFAELVGAAFLACRVGEADALLLAFDQDADYDSPNFLWFRARYARFVYVDRIVVDPGMRGRGIARALYAELFRRAAGAGHDRVGCEVNADPPNPPSDAFHAALGFAEVGSATIHDGRKTIRYFARRVG